MNAVVVAVIVMLALSLARVNVVFSLFIGAISGGLIGGLGIPETLSAYGNGLGNGASIALSYGMLGAFAMSISRSGIPEMLAARIIARTSQSKSDTHMKLGLLGSIILMAVASQNLVPVHIAFIPILIPPLLAGFSRMNLDRRLVACVITFGLTATYMLLPVGFGNIFLVEILANSLNNNGLNIDPGSMPSAMIIPVGGMFLGLLVAFFFTYRKPRAYKLIEADVTETTEHNIGAPQMITVAVAIVLALVAQLQTGSMALGAMLGCMTLAFGRVIRWNEMDDVFVNGMKMMAFCGFIMISAAGFAEVIRETGSVGDLVAAISDIIGDNKGLAALLMLLVGLLITLGIGSSFSTIPIIATLYVPLGIELGFTPLAIAALVGTAGALGDAGSPASDSTIGPTSGLNADGQHDHIWDTVVPTFIHYNIPQIVFGWIAAMIL